MTNPSNLPSISSPEMSKDIILSASTVVAEKTLVKVLLKNLQERMKEDPKFKWVLLGGSIYLTARVLNFDTLNFWPVSSVFDWFYNKITVPESCIMWGGEIEPDIHFGRLGYTRCLESDPHVLEKYGVPMNSEKCIRSGISYIPGEKYQQFDLNEFDSKVTPMTWTYGPITDPTFITPTCWYNDMSGENREFELFQRSMRIFGYLPPEAYQQLYQHCKVMLLRTNQHLIRIGDPDDKMYIIVSGAVDVYSNGVGAHGDFIRLRTAMHGGQIMSLFSIIDCITGNAKNIKSISAISKLNSTKVLIFPIAAFKEYLVKHQEYMVASIIRLMERSYRLQYQILHLAWHLTSTVTSLNTEPIYDLPNILLPPPGQELSERIKNKALQSFMEFFGIDDIEFLKEHCEIDVVEPEEPTNDLVEIKSTLLNKASVGYKYLYIGKLEGFHLKSNLNIMDQQARRKFVEEEIITEPLFHVLPREGVGSLTGILGYSNTLFCRATERSIVVTLSRHGLESFFKKHPLSIFPVAFMTVYRMSPFTRSVDFAMDWMVAKVGQYIYHKEQMCHNSYLLLSGHARAYKVDTETTRQRAVLEYRENDWIGLTESLLLSKRRSKTCVVIRESEFVTIPNDLLRNIVINYSSAAQIMLNFLVQRTYHSRKFEALDMDVQIHEQSSFRESRRTCSIALIPVAEGLPYSVLAVEIKRHHQSWGSCVILTYTKMLADLQVDEITEKDQFMLEMYTLAQLEVNDLVIFVCLPRLHYWNEICSKYSEVVFTVCCSELPNIPTEPPEWEERIIGKSISTRRKELIILHSMDVVLPRNTKEWLYCRDWLHFHHHIRLPNEAFTFLGAIPEDQVVNALWFCYVMMEATYKCLYREIQLTSDMSRFLRWLLGKTFGVLFSSGGARIGSQLGMLQALLEYKMIPIDMVVGTGAGFLLAVLYAIYQDYDTVQKIIEKVFKDFKELLRFHWDDFSIPYISSNKGKRLLVYFYQLFGSIQLEDTFLPVCCVTTNLTSQNVRVERSGPVWVFVRASLTHTNHSPPICDPIDGDYIGDGAHANSLPEDVLKEYGAEYIIAFNTVGTKLLDNNIADPNMSFFRYIAKASENFLRQCGLANPSFEDVFNKLAVTQTRMYAASQSFKETAYSKMTNAPSKMVQFNETVKIHIYERDISQSQVILDRMRFQDRILQAAHVLDPILLQQLENLGIQNCRVNDHEDNSNSK